MNIHTNIERLPLASSEEYHSIQAIGPQLDRVFTLRYRSYVAEGYIEENQSKKFMDKHDSQPSNLSFLTYKDNQLIGSLRASIYMPNSDYKIPAMDIYEEEIDSSIGKNRPLVECNKFVIDPKHQRRGGIRSRFSMFKNIIDTAERVDAAGILIAVRSEHIKFYSMLFCNPISASKRYPGLKFDTTLLLCQDIKQAKNKIWSKLGLENKPDDPILNYSIN